MKDVPSVIAYHHVHPWLHGNLVHVDLDFNLLEGAEDFKDRMNAMLNRFEKGDLKEYVFFILFHFILAC